MTARGTDWGLAALVALLSATGALTLLAGGSGQAWVFAAHDGLGIAIALLLIVKLRRVWPRLMHPGRWGRRATAGVVGVAVVVGVLASGLLWAAGETPSPGGYSLLSWHDALGAVLVIVVGAHMVLRAKPLRGRDLAHRRQFLGAAGIGVASLVAWRTQRPFEALVALRGAKRRFTGSYESGSFAGNAFPATSWVADNPRPIDPAGYRLLIGGLVQHERSFALRDLSALDELVATLDCTGGFYSTQRWRGVRIGRLIDRGRGGAGREPSARGLGHGVSVELRSRRRARTAAGDARGRAGADPRARGSGSARRPGGARVSVGQMGGEHRTARPSRLRRARLDDLEQPVIRVNLIGLLGFPPAVASSDPKEQQ